MKFPGSARVFPIGFGVAQIAARAANDLGFAVPSDIGEAGRFVVENVEDNMALPVAFAPFGVFVPGGFFARKAVNENVGPAILVEVVRKEEKAVGISIVHAEAAFEAGNGFFGAIGFFVFEGSVGRAELVTLFEVWAFVP